MTEETALTPVAAHAMEQVIIGGDLGQLSPQDRLDYYRRVCESVGLNPFTKPFAYIRVYDSESKSKRLQLYPTKDCAEQLRRMHKISFVSVEHSAKDGLIIVSVLAKTKDGRHDRALGVVPMDDSMKPMDRANAYMKAETKAKRRATLSLAGLGFGEGSIGGDTVVVDAETGEIEEPEALPEPESIGQSPTGYSNAGPEPSAKGLAERSEEIKAAGGKVCEEHNRPWGMGFEGQLGHPVQGGGWCEKS